MVPFLHFQANDLENWFTKAIVARTKFAVLLRTLIHSTGKDLQKVDFPGNDDAERAGWDGFIEACTSTPWIPSGSSGWEFGVNRNIKVKANKDFEKSVRANNKADRENTTFIFVTPRRWPGKTAWIKEHKAKKLWKDIRAYDSSDLEQWMEQSPAAQIWFANQTDYPSNGVRTLERCWNDWANVATPPLHASLFATAKDDWNCQIRSFLTQKNISPLVITADSVEEALAFLNQALSFPDLEQYKNQVLVFDKTEVIPKLAQGTTNFIAVAHTREVERELGPYSSSLRTILVYPHNATTIEPNIALEPLRFEPFAKALEAMGKSRDEIKKLAIASGCSLTVLRRQLSNIPAIHTPTWSKDSKIATELVPFVFLGTWSSQNKIDQNILSRLAKVPFEELEQRLHYLLGLNDSPVWAIGPYRGVVSKIDSLFAIANSVSQAHIDRFLDVARTILGEDDPALDLPETERWAAAIHGKQRKFSATMRRNLAETLVLLAVHGKNLFGKRLGFDGEIEVAKIVRELLVPVTTRKLEANEHELPYYAEASPSEFLNIIERDLQAEKSEVIPLLKPVNSGFFCSYPRTGLLWALEGLAWNPATFPQVVRILGQLSEIEINDNLANTPIKSLESILCAWMPQTAANYEMRLKAIQMLLKKFPAIGWKVCIQQFGDTRTLLVGSFNYKPKWRLDGFGFGETFERKEHFHKFVREIVNIALSRPSYTVEMLSDLVAKLPALASEDQTRIWNLIQQWHRVNTKDEELAQMREIIRKKILSRREYIQVDKNIMEKAKSIYVELQPKNIVNRYEWLFRHDWIDGWLNESLDNQKEDKFDISARTNQLKQLRIEALSDIVKECGIIGFFEIADKAKNQKLIGSLLASDILSKKQIKDLIFQCFHPTENSLNHDNIIAGALLSLNEDSRKAIYESLRNNISEEETLRLLLLSPYRATTWELVDQLPAQTRNRYWDEVIPHYLHSKKEKIESVQRLLKAKRPRAAFASVHFELSDIPPYLIAQILSAMLKKTKDKDNEYLLDLNDVECAFQIINRNSDLSLEEKAGLEFAYLEVLSRSVRSNKQQKFPNLERYIENHPELFVQAIVWTYKRDDNGEDPPEVRINEDHEYWQTHGYYLLKSIEQIPGQDQATKEEKYKKLMKWVSSVRKLSAELGRSKCADVCLGLLFSNAPVGTDGVWPNEVIRDVIEDIHSVDICRGTHVGLYNARGIHTAGEGGDQERKLAEKYHVWADALKFTHPFVSSLLMSMVNTYEHEAEQRDTELDIERRLWY